MNNSIFKKVIDGGYCIGCAACTVIDNSPIRIKFNDQGMYRAELKDNFVDNAVVDNVMEVCPFSGIGEDETTIGRSLYGDNKFDSHLGFYEANYAGYVNEGDFRSNGSSGGMGSWILNELYQKDMIDYVIHVKESTDPELLFEFGISNDEASIQKSAKSRYYPVEMSKVLQFVKANPGRYAIVGLPCFIKSIRLLSKKEQIFAERIKFCVGLVCGHLKSSYFAEMMAMQVGFDQSQFENINFRHKIEGKPASRYGVNIKGYDNNKQLKEIMIPTADLFGTNWGHGFFKYNACEYCDDVLSETADITIGDAWLPEYDADSKGTNVIIVRNRSIHNLIQSAMEQNRLVLDKINAEKIIQSQASGLRHRREGLSYRLHLKNENNEWYPNKRVKPSDNISKKRKKTYKGRLNLNSVSFSAFEKAKNTGDFNDFISIMKPMVDEYSKIERPSLVRRILSKGKRLVKGQ